MQKKENNREPKENKRYKTNKGFTGDYTKVNLQFHHCWLLRTGTATAEHVYSFKFHKNILILTENEPSSVILLTGKRLWQMASQ